jgi:hypothetical protein
LIKLYSKEYQQIIQKQLSPLTSKLSKKNQTNYFTHNQNYEEDVLKYWRHLIGRPPKTIQSTYVGGTGATGEGSLPWLW